jgi:site-specific DNA-methyltransferase (adenine-specific)
MTYELNRIYNMDCMVAMKEIPDKYFELAIVDPPYGIKINMNMGRRKGKRPDHVVKNWDDAPPDGEYFDELFRVSQNQIIWGGNYFELPITKSWIFWDKQVPNGVTFADGELAWTSFSKTLIKVTIQYSGFNGLDVGGKIHPTQKPVALYHWLLRNYAKPGDKILDTHMGSGSSIIACHDMGFEYMAFEIDKDYYDAAMKRIEAHKAQLRMDI